jgi:4-hydroxy-tetrahydrodipicolinate reductase
VIRAVVCGAAGRMGGRIIALMREAGDFALAGAVERADHPALGRDAGEVAGIGKAGVPIGPDLAQVARSGQVGFDFTAPEAAIANIAKAADAGLAMVVGTTGMTPEALARARDLARRIPLLVAPNMSVGVNVMYTLLAQAAAKLGDEYDVEVSEIHHHFKADAPSGTAVKMAQVIAGALGRDLDQVGVFGRKGMVGERKPQEIGVHALRGGDIAGEHTVIFAGMGERVEITHRAHSRDNFARGALRAARWLAGKPAGLYDMGDALGLK